MLDPVISLLAALCGALLFGSAALHKLRAPREFAVAVAEYRLVPAPVVPIAAFVLALAEVAVCAAFVWPAARSAAATAGVGMLLLYAIAMVINLASGRRDLDCGCGMARRTINGWMVMRNVGLTVVIALPSLPLSQRMMTPIDYATVAGGLVVCALLYASSEMLLPRQVFRGLNAMESS